MRSVDDGDVGGATRQQIDTSTTHFSALISESTTPAPHTNADIWLDS